MTPLPAFDRSGNRLVASSIADRRSLALVNGMSVGKLYWTQDGEPMVTALS